MEQSKRGGRSVRIRALKRLRLLLSILALVLCGVIVFCAVTLCSRGQLRNAEQTTAQTTEETAQPTQIETVTEPPTMPVVPSTEPTTVPEAEGESEPYEPQAEPPETQNDGDAESFGEQQDQFPDQERINPEGLNRDKDPDQQELVNDQVVKPTTQPEAALPADFESPTVPASVETTVAEQETESLTQATTAETTAAEAALPKGNDVDSEQPDAEPDNGLLLAILIVSVVLLVLDLMGIAACTAAISKLRKQARKAGKRSGTVDRITHTISNGTKQPASVITIGQLHNIGARPYQEDSSGVAKLDDGVFSVVADGMGGLSGGDKVSQQIVYTMLEYTKTLHPGQMDGVLEQMVSAVTDTVNKTLGPAGLRKSGSTLMAVLARKNRFHWITVGDSHIYLYHDGTLVQLNQEHNRGQELLRQAIAGFLTFDEVRADPQKSGLTSYIGMGQLRYVDRSLHSIPLTPGDRVLLMTDGVFNALSETEICTVLRQYPDVVDAAQMLERGVIAKAYPHQDNFTAVILGF